MSPLEKEYKETIETIAIPKHHNRQVHTFQEKCSITRHKDVRDSIRKAFNRGSQSE